MDPTLRPSPVSSVASLTSVTFYNSTARLNNGILRGHQFSVVTPARLHRSDVIFQFYVYGSTFDNTPRYLLSAHGTVSGALCADRLFGYVGTTGVLSGSVSDFMVWDGGLPFSGIS
jgi:hypothetical protein